MHYEIFISFLRSKANALVDKGFMKSYINNCIDVYGVSIGKLEWYKQVKIISRIFKIVSRSLAAENIGIKLICECFNHIDFGVVDIIDEI